MPKCRVWGCDQHSDKGITTHRFPYKTDLERARRWLILCKIEFGDIKKFNFENLVICGKHFADSAYEEDMQMRLLSLQYPEKYGSSKPRKKLKSDAVPSLHLPSTAHQPKERDTSVNRSRRMERKRCGGQRGKLDADCSIFKESIYKPVIDDSMKGTTISDTSKTKQPGPSKQGRPTCRQDKKATHATFNQDPSTSRLQVDAASSSRSPRYDPSTSHPSVDNIHTSSTQPLVQISDIQVTPSQPQASTSSAPEHQAALLSTLEYPISLVTQGTQTDDIFADPDTVKKDHHYYLLTPKKKPEKQLHPMPAESTEQPHLQAQPVHQPQLPAEQHPAQEPMLPLRLIHHSTPRSSDQVISSTPHYSPKKLFCKDDLDRDSGSSDSNNSGAEDSDPDYQESESSSSSDEESERRNSAASYVTACKFLVFESELRDLFRLARCKQCNHVYIIPDNDEPFGTVVGSSLSVKVQCLQGHEYSWNSQPTVGKGSAAIPAGNLLIPAAILFSGSNFAKVSHFANLLHWEIVSKTTHNTHQADYLFPTVHDTWHKAQEGVLDSLPNSSVKLSGDGRCDTPGYSAKFGTYSVMDMDTSKIIDLETVQVTEVTSSNAMEKEGCKRVLDRLEEKKVTVEVLCTDRHVSIQKMMREKYPNIVHQYDVWHLAKSVSKKLVQKAKKKETEDLMPWVPAIKNHLWWSAATCKGDTIEMLEKWQSVIYHVTNEHNWGYGQVFQQCAHAPLGSEEEETIKWIGKESAAHMALNKVVQDKKILEGVKKLNLFCHTGQLENFNGFLTKYCPKRIGFSYEGMVARTKLAALDHNYNVGRQQAVVKQPKKTSAPAGERRFQVVCPKATKKWVPKPVFEEKTYDFIDDMMIEVLERKLQGKKESDSFKHPKLAKNIAPAAVTRPTKIEAVASCLSRFGH